MVNKIYIAEDDIAPGTPEDFKDWHEAMCIEGAIYVPYDKWLAKRFKDALEKFNRGELSNIELLKVAPIK